jgi:hypothetical protein
MSLDVVFERIGFVIQKRLAARLLSVCLSVKCNYLIRGRRLVRKIRGLIEQDIEDQFKHVYREANKVADWLANLGCNLANGSILYEFPPREVQALVDDDVSEVSTSRMIRV